MPRLGVGRLGPMRALPITKRYLCNRCSRSFRLEYTDHDTTSSWRRTLSDSSSLMSTRRPGCASGSC